MQQAAAALCHQRQAVECGRMEPAGLRAGFAHCSTAPFVQPIGRRAADHTALHCSLSSKHMHSQAFVNGRER